jgi:hypothetical protein
MFGSVLTTQTYATRGLSGELQTTDYTPAVRRSPLRMVVVGCVSDFSRTEFDTIGCFGLLTFGPFCALTLRSFRR